LEVALRILLITVAATAVATLALGADAPRSYADARANWEKHFGSTQYQTYGSEFVQFNNHLHLDEKGGCYALGPEHVELMLVITNASGSEFAVVENALTDVDTPKARCFVKSYLGLRPKVPPYVPFVLHMTMG
jgi:hypothetical protein